MAGFWHQSFQQLHDLNGRPYAGCKAYFYAADSLDPITVYQDYSLGTAHANPVVADAFGVFPAVFLDEDDGFYRQIIKSASGITLAGNDLTVLPIIGPGVGGGGSEVPVDANALFKTGYPLWIPVSGTLAGFVRMNGRTIGSATSGAAERANADCELLYLYNWQTYSNTFCPVTGGRGLSAAADWAENKPIALLNMQNKGPFGLDDMGGTAANGFTGITFVSGDATTPASVAGAARATILQTNLPAVTLTTTIAAGQGSHKHQVSESQSGGGSTTTAKLMYGNDTGSQFQTDAPMFDQTLPAMTGTTPLGGSGTGLDKLPPIMLGTWYQKLAILVGAIQVIRIACVAGGIAC